MLRKVSDIPFPVRNVSVSVFDNDNNGIEAGHYETLPTKRTLSALAEFDGYIDVLKGGFLSDRIKIKGDEKVFFDVDLNRTYRFYQGTDCVYELSYHRSQKNKALNDDETLRRLKSFKGHPVSISHTFGAVAMRLENLPQTRIWVMRQLHLGVMDKQAKEYIQRLSPR